MVIRALYAGSVVSIEQHIPYGVNTWAFKNDLKFLPPLSLSARYRQYDGDLQQPHFLRSFRLFYDQHALPLVQQYHHALSCISEER